MLDSLWNDRQCRMLICYPYTILSVFFQITFFFVFTYAILTSTVIVLTFFLFIKKKVKVDQIHFEM